MKKKSLRASLTIALVAAAVPAHAAKLPAVMTDNGNQVPACATPGRLMAYLNQRNSRLDPRFDGVATEYMRHGEAMGIRWDQAFFQMLLETGNLKFSGDVRANQNNFAGLGATGGGAHGESFSDISTGVKAHLQHLLLYAGKHVDDPVAERTRKVQEWQVLDDWQNSISGPMTFDRLAEKWAPGSRKYSYYIKEISADFYDGYCNGPDPRPDLVQEARQGRQGAPTQQVAAVTQSVPEQKPQAQADTAPASPGKGAEIASRAIEQERQENPPMTGLGAGSLSKVAEAAKAAAASSVEKTETTPAVTLLNPTKTAQETAPAETAAVDTAAAAGPSKTHSVKAEEMAAKFQVAAAGGTATQLKIPDAKPSADSCKVWTASYGGQRGIIIKAASGDKTNYTVLDVHENTMKREVDAYIAAYAKGGEQIAEFATPAAALDKAFELCPEG